MRLGSFEAKVLGEEVGISEWDRQNSGYRNSY